MSPKISAVFERLPAKKYYGPHASGSVILKNGYPIFHGSTPESSKLLKRIQSRINPIP